MNNIDVEKLPLKNIELNNGLYVTDLIVKDNAIIAHNKNIDDNYWNYAYLKKVNNDSIPELRRFFHSKKLPFSVYVLNTLNFDKESFLKKNKMKLSYKDAIMVYEGFEKKDLSFDTKVVKDLSGESDFLKVYNEVFTEEGEDVYSGLSSGYEKSMKDYFKNYPADKRYDLVIYDDDNPVGVATVVFDAKYAEILNVAVIESARRKGFAKSLSNKCINKFLDRIVFLGTEEGSENEEIYKRMGFKTVAIGECYIEEEK